MFECSSFGRDRVWGDVLSKGDPSYYDLFEHCGAPGGDAGDFWRLPIKGGDFRGRPGNGGVGRRPTTQHSGSKIIPFIRCVTVGGDLLLLLLLLLLHVLLRLFVDPLFLMSLFL